jgi:CRISPR/Cas system CSM-associated protein Csm4 (group 5 of RAMP superfamily)
MPEFREGELLNLLFRKKDGASANTGETAYWMLSLFLPDEGDQIDWRRGNYHLTARSGRAESEAGWGEAKRVSRMISEGSVLIAPASPQGAVADVAPAGFAHPIYRAGYALAVPVPLRPGSSTGPAA